MRTLFTILLLCLCFYFISANPADSLKASKNMLHISAFYSIGTIHYNDNTFIHETGEFIKNESDIFGAGIGFGLNFSKKVYKNWFISIPIFYRHDIEYFWLKYNLDNSENVEYSLITESNYFNLGLNAAHRFQLYKSPSKNCGFNLYPFAGFNFRYLINKVSDGTAFYSENYKTVDLEQVPFDYEGKLFCDPLAGIMLEIKVNEFLIQPKFHIQKDNRDRYSYWNTKTKSYSTVLSLAVGF